MEKTNYTILIAEDDKDIVELLKLYLEKNGYRVLTAGDGEEALRLIESEDVDFGIFDIMMPKMDGISLIKEVRKKKNFPIMVLSAKNQDVDKIMGLDVGADDYMTKPFNPMEVVARVRAGLRRFYNLNDDTKESDNTVVRVGEFVLDPVSISITKNGENILLTPMEFKILALLMKSPGRVFTKNQIFEFINGQYIESDDNTLMVHISKLREKIEDDPKNPKYLKTVRGLGYRFER